MLVTLLTLVISAAPAKPTALILDINPKGTIVWVDGKKKGVISKPLEVKLQPGRHIIKLSYKGDSHEEEVDVKKGERKTWKWAFEGVEEKPKAAPKPAEDESGEKKEEPEKKDELDWPSAEPKK